MTDDECIATALLHGIEPEHGKDNVWYNCLEGPFHEIEEANFALTGKYGFKTCAALCRAWCEFYNLEG